MTPMDRLWDRLKETAENCAHQGERPTHAQARHIVAELVLEAHVSPKPPNDAIEYLTNELLQLVDAASSAVR